MMHSTTETKQCVLFSQKFESCYFLQPMLHCDIRAMSYIGAHAYPLYCSNDSIMVLICIVLHITWWMVHRAIWHWHYDSWLFVQCLVT